MGLVNIQITNFENGINNRNAADLFGSLAMLDPTRFHTFMEDFDYYDANDRAISQVGVGTQALQSFEGGALRLTTAGADNDSALLSKTASFRWELGRPTYHRFQFLVDDTVESVIISGIVNSVAFAPTGGCYIRKNDDGTTADVIYEGTSGQVAALGVIDVPDDNERHNWAFYWDGISRIYYGFDGAALGFLDLDDGAGNINLATGNHFVLFGCEAGQAAALNLDVDYFFAATERTGATEP